MRATKRVGKWSFEEESQGRRPGKCRATQEKKNGLEGSREARKGRLTMHACKRGRGVGGGRRKCCLGGECVFLWCGFVLDSVMIHVWLCRSSLWGKESNILEGGILGTSLQGPKVEA